MSYFDNRAKIAAHFLSIKGLSQLGDSRDVSKALEIGFFHGCKWAEDQNRELEAKLTVAHDTIQKAIEELDSLRRQVQNDKSGS